MAHAGSSITITSLTNAIALFLGCSTSLVALRSFCIFAGIGIMMLYISSCTLFASYMVYDLQRQEARTGDCFGACCCKEDSWICCGGYFLTEK
jgi:predicted RND superfamily exporter protein